MDRSPNDRDAPRPGGPSAPIADHGQDETLERIRHALGHSGRDDAVTRVTDQIDREALQTIDGSPDPDRLLGGLETETLLALAERRARACAEATDDDRDSRRRLAWDTLDRLRQPAVLRRIGPDRLEAWTAALLRLVEISDFTVGPLFRQRAARYGSKTLFELPRDDGIRSLNWRQIASRVDFLSRGLLTLDSSDSPAPVAILSDNRLEMALVDLACLTAGLVNVMIPANATEADVGYMLGHSKVGTVIVSDKRQLEKVLSSRESLPGLARVVAIEPEAAQAEGVLSLDELTSRAVHIPASLVVQRSEAVRIDDLATVMYTSGTTGMPKGIRFSHRNLVFKRFARALALPEIGEGDLFLAFLPLYHTFGRFFEMMGCIFWGATYAFLESHSPQGLVTGMRRHRPTVFISVPKKWMQLYDAIGEVADPLSADDRELLEAVRTTTGGRLRWGLSAAGHLDSDIFRFFQRHGVELLSGFGMTEATGGITMTPPGAYSEDSLGPALPGIELRIAEDRELLVRGPYVMQGYLDPPDGETSLDDEGWLATGDLMEVDPDGHLRLIDRKKEIYKNIKGETIAPQRVENAFRDFESVGRSFLVGDHREYNTLLLYPNPDYSEVDLTQLGERELWDHFRSLVVSVNKFLAPYERVVDFAVVERDLEESRGELTPKGTPRRKIVVEHFADVIDSLYQRTNLHVGGIELTLPNWLFQTLGLTAQDIRIAEDRVYLPTTGATLQVARQADDVTRIGSGLYRHTPGPLNLGTLLTTTALWLGNGELVDFVALDDEARQRPGRAKGGIEWIGRAEPPVVGPAEWDALEAALIKDRFELIDADLAMRLVLADDEQAALQAVALARRILEGEDARLAPSARLVLRRARGSSSRSVARKAFVCLVPAEPESRFAKSLAGFLERQPDLLDLPTRDRLAEATLSPAKIDAFIARTRAACGVADPDDQQIRAAASLLQFLSVYGAAHPISYRRLRAALVRLGTRSSCVEIQQAATAAAVGLQQGFRHWLGPSARITVDPETGQEYRWEDVVVFEEGTPEEHRSRLLSAIRETAFLRESFFLFSAGALIHLSDIPPGGVWIRLLGQRHGKSVYRVTVQTRYRGAFDLAVNVNDSMSRLEVDEEIHWLVLAGAPGGHYPLVEDFGGYWLDQDLWSEEFIAGDTLDRSMVRLARGSEREERFRQLWPFLAWSTLSAYVDFWDRSGRKLELADPSMSNVVVPTEDYHIGARLVSLSARRPHRGLAAMLLAFRQQFVEPAEREYPQLEGLVDWEIIFSSLLEIVGEEPGLELLEHSAAEAGETLPPPVRERMVDYVRQVRAHGFRPMRLYFAIKRYRRWSRLSGDATTRARARTLLELYDTYGIGRLVRVYPETRLRYFRDTVFREARPALARGLDELIGLTRKGELLADELIDAVTDLRSRLDLNEEEDYFLARLSLPHLRPEDSAGFVSSYLGGRHQSEIVVSLDDSDGRPYRVRRALNPKEVERLHRLFVAARLEVHFRAEHQYLVALNDRGQIIAGIYYDVDEEEHTAHLEKIVANEAYRRKGVADGLMHQFFSRLSAAGIRTVTTGFFRPEYFYGYGFRIEKRYAGLVKSLEPEPEESG